MQTAHYLLLILAILPLIYKYAFWFYVIQLKEYRWDRFKEYISTPQWNSAVINIWSVLELPLLLTSLFIFINSPLEIIIYNVLFVFLLIQNLFVFRKILKRKIIKPKITGRLFLTVFILLSWIFFELSYIITNNITNIIYSYILFSYLFAPFVIFLCIILTLPLVNFLKNRKINKAIKLSNNYKNPIKIWITWSYWKTSVKEFLASILEQDWKTLYTPENINTELGVTNLILKKLDNTYKYLIAEMWAYKIGEIELLWDIVNHKYWFITAIWNQHLWLFWSKDNIKDAKSEISNSVLKNNGILYINWDNKKIRQTSFDKKLNIIKYWNFKWSDAKYIILETKNAVTEFEFEYKKSKATFKTWLIWEHNIINITWVIAFCYDLWIKTSTIEKYLKNIKTPKNTLEIIKSNNYILIDDTYNLSDASIFTWLKVLKSFKLNKILILDDILELWKISKDFHYELWIDIAKKYNKIQILYIWVNYKEEFIKWLIDWWYKKSLILKNQYMIEDKSVILFEWRGTRKYLDNLK